mgnify:CR=1 FL=1
MYPRPSFLTGLFFAASDRLAFGVLEYLQELDARIPERFGLIGFDGMSAGTVCNPPLTTVAPELPLAAEALLTSAIDGNAPATQRVGVKLVERASVRKLADANDRTNAS